MNRLLEMLLSRGVLSPEGGSDGGDGGTVAEAGAESGAGAQESEAGAEAEAGATPSAGEQATAEGGEAAGAGESATAPVEIPPLTNENVKLPEGLTASEETISDLIGVLNNNEASPQERLDNLVGLGKKLVAEAEAARAAQWIESQKAAGKEITEGAEFGGDKLAESQAVIANVLQEFGSPELNALIDASGVGNSIVFYRFLHKIGSLMAEGKPVVGAPTSAEKPPLAERMYPNQGKS